MTLVFRFMSLAALIFFAEGGCFIPAVAAPMSTIEIRASDLLENPEPEGWTLGFESSSYVSWKNHPDNDRNPYGVKLGVEKLYRFSKFELAVSADAFYSANQSLLNYSHVDELNFRFKDLWGANEVVMGRYRKQWSGLDAYWRLGMFNPMFQWNYLKPDEQGLTGFFFNWKTNNNLQVDLFASPFFIPSQGPSFSVRDGQFESANPWFSIPVDQVLINSEYIDLRYKIHEPNASNVIMNPGIAFRVGAVNEAQKTWWNVSGAFKPSNNLAMGLAPRGEFDNEFDIDVNIYPFVLYHSVASGEYGWHFSNSDLLMTASAEWPNAITIPEKQSAYQPGRNILISPIWTYYLNKKKDRRLSFAYLYRDEQEFSHVGLLKYGRAASSSDRYFFKNALSAGYQGKVLASLPLTFSTQGVYDFERKGVLILGELSYALSAKWNIAMGMETIGVEDETLPNYRNSFMQYRSNDRFYGGMTYVF